MTEILVKSYRGEHGSTWYEQPLEEVSDENRKWFEKNNPTYIEKIDADNEYKKAWNDRLENIIIPESQWEAITDRMEKANEEFMKANS